MNRQVCEMTRLWPNLRYYLVIYLNILRETIMKYSQNSLLPGRDLGRGPPKYKAGVLTTRRQLSVANY
jgi:hypothetical protein